MHPIARVLAVAYVVLAAVSAVVYAQAVSNYTGATELILSMPGNAHVSRVEVVWSGNSSDLPLVRVFIEARNPGRVWIETAGIDFQLHMDDPDDALPWNDPNSLAQTWIRSGGNQTDRGEGVRIPPGGVGTVEAVVPIQGPDQTERFNKTDAQGRFHPIVMSPRFGYYFVDFHMGGTIFVAPYYEELGVLPRG